MKKVLNLLGTLKREELKEMVDKFKRETLEKMEKEELIEQCLALQEENWNFQKSYYIKPRRRVHHRQCYNKDRKDFTQNPL